MALSAQQQVRHIYVASTGLAAPAIGDIDAQGELGVVAADGSAVAGATDSKVVVYSNGQQIASPLIPTGQGLYLSVTAYKAPTLGSVTFDAVAAPVAGSLYTATITIQGYGSFSPEDEYLKKGFYKAASGDDAEAVVDGLIASLNRNFSREVGATASSNPYFAFTKSGVGAAAQLVITEKTDWLATGWKLGKKEALNIKFFASLSVTTGELVASTDVAGDEGVGQGKQIASMEWYLKGERNDFYREAGYPHNFDNVYDADPTATYNVIECGFWKEGRDEAKKSKQQITIPMLYTDAASNANTNNVAANLATAIGLPAPAALPVV